MTSVAWREEAIEKKHDRRGFDCGQAELNTFLAQHARQAHESGASKTFVAVDPADGVAVLGFYTLAPTELDFERVPPVARPKAAGRHPVAGIRLFRLAVSRSLQRRRLGGALLLSAALRCIRASDEIGGNLLVIDAKDAAAAAWYGSYGAIGIPRSPLTLVLPYSVVIDAMKAAGRPLP